MSVDQLRELATIAETLSGDAKEVLILWLLYKWGYLAASFIGLMVLLAVVYRGVMNIVKMMNTSGRLMRAAGVSHSWSSTEEAWAIKVLEEAQRSK